VVGDDALVKGLALGEAEATHPAGAPKISEADDVEWFCPRSHPLLCRHHALLFSAAFL